jgi:hypothetical protein
MNSADATASPTHLPIPCHYPDCHHLQVTTIERFTNYHIQQSEAFRCHKLPACSAAAGRSILTHTIILDMAGLSPTRHFTLTVKHFLESISKIDQVRQQQEAHALDTTMLLCANVLQPTGQAIQRLAVKTLRCYVLVVSKPCTMHHYVTRQTCNEV